MSTQSGDTSTFTWVLMFMLMCLFAGIMWGLSIQQTRMLHHACAGACERLGTQMQSVQGNLCVCQDLTTMRGDYGQLFLGGERR